MKNSKNNSQKYLVFATCFLPMDDVQVSMFNELAKSLSITNGKLVVASADRERIKYSKNLFFEHLNIAASLAQHDWAPKAYNEIGFEPDFYEEWLGEVDSSWWGKHFGGDFKKSARGIAICQKIAHEVLEALNPSVCLIWSSGVYPVSRIWHDVSRHMGIPTFCFERGPLPGTLTLDSLGMNALSDARAHPLIRRILMEHKGSSKISKYRVWYEKFKPKKYTSTAYSVNNLTELSKNGNKLILILGCLDTAGLIPRKIPGSEITSPGYPSTWSLLSFINKSFENKPDLVFLFKPHPGEASNYNEDFFGRIHILKNYDVHELIKLSDVVVAGLTGLAFEALVMERPLVLVGRSSLEGMNVAYDALYPNQLKSKITLALKNGISPFRSKINSVLDGMLTNYLFSSDKNIPAIPLSELSSFCQGFARFIPAKLDLAKAAANSIDIDYLLRDDALVGIASKNVQSIQKYKIIDLNLKLNHHKGEIKQLNQSISERDARVAYLNKIVNENENKSNNLSLHVKHLEEVVFKRDEQISSLNTEFALIQQRLSEKEAAINNLHQLTSERDQKICELLIAIDKRDEQISSLNTEFALIQQRLSEKEAAINNLHQLTSERDQKICELLIAIDKRDEQISSLNTEFALIQQRLSEKEAAINNLHQLTSERDQKIRNQSQHVLHLEETILDRDNKINNIKYHVTHLEEVITNRDAEISLIKNELRLVYESNSWRMTKWIRSLRRKLAIFYPPYLINYRTYSTLKNYSSMLPIPGLFKVKVRSWLRLNYSANYYVDYENSRDHSLVTTYLPIDGTREWQAYKPLINAATDNAVQRLKSVQVKPIKILDYSLDEIKALVKTIRFPVNTTPLVSIIIPVFEGIKFTMECLESISRARTNIPYEIIVSDDASSDETFDLLHRMKGIRYIRQDKNIGFLKNCNYAFPQCQGKFTLILNNDVQVCDGWLDGLISVFNEYSDAGSAGPKIIYPSGHLQEAGVAIRSDGSTQMIGLNDDPNAAFSNFSRSVDYCSGACLMVPTKLLRKLEGFSEEYSPAYYEDADLGMRIIAAGFKNYYAASATVVHHLSKTMMTLDNDLKSNQILKNSVLFQRKWGEELQLMNTIRCIAFYLPQFHEIQENNEWWGTGFTEWVNVKKARPNFNGHLQPRVPINENYYNLENIDVLKRQAELARKYGIDGFCFYYYWFNGKRLLEKPIEIMLENNEPEFPFCLCWANENWTRRWDGRDNEILIAQNHGPYDDELVIKDLMRYFKSPSYIRIDKKPLLLIYRVDLFPDFKETAKKWQQICKSEGIGEIYIAMVESHDLVHKDIHPSYYGCNASVEFPPLNMGVRYSKEIDDIDKKFSGTICDYIATIINYCDRDLPAYKRFRGVMPGWDNTARRQNNGVIFKDSSPGAFQAWLEFVIAQTNKHLHGEEKIIFINAWNEWAEGAYLEPDNNFGYSFLEAVKMAKDAQNLLKNQNE